MRIIFILTILMFSLNDAASPSFADQIGLPPDSRKLFVSTSTLANAPDAQSSQVGSQAILKTSASGAEVMSQLNTFKQAVNSAEINYDAHDVNSNSFAFDAAQGLTGTRPAATPDPGYEAKGSNLTTGVKFDRRERKP